MIPDQELKYDYLAAIRVLHDVKALSSEYYGDPPRLFGSKDLEARYGERKPGIPSGRSWRAAAMRASGQQSITSAWSMNSAM